MDLFLVHTYLDAEIAAELEDTFAGRGIELADPLALWPEQRLLPLIDAGLRNARHALVVVTPEFLKFNYARKELDGLANRSRVLSLLHGIDERAVAAHSPRLAVASFSGQVAEHLIRLVHPHADD